MYRRVYTCFWHPRRITHLLCILYKRPQTRRQGLGCVTALSPRPSGWETGGGLLAFRIGGGEHGCVLTGRFIYCACPKDATCFYLSSGEAFRVGIRLSSVGATKAERARMQEAHIGKRGISKPKCYSKSDLRDLERQRKSKLGAKVDS